METDIEIATLGNMRGLKRRMESEGNFVAKIAKVVVSELDNVDPVRSSVALLLPDDERVDVLLNKLTIASPMEGSGEDVHNMCRAEKRLIVLQWIRTL